jgi:hypothetical protein
MIDLQQNTYTLYRSGTKDSPLLIWVPKLEGIKKKVPDGLPRIILFFFFKKKNTFQWHFVIVLLNSTVW